MKRRVHLRTIGLVSAALVAGSLAAAGAGGGASAATVTDVRVGSFNITGVHTDSGATGDFRTWRERRPKVVTQILAQRLDVVGVQEANNSTSHASRLSYGETQYMDLLGHLNRSGGNYAVTNAHNYNCVNSRSTYKCVYKDQEAAGDNRIYYDTDTVSMVRQGAITYTDKALNKPDRYLGWAVLQMKATGKQFFFANTHLDPYDIEARKKQWDQMISTINSLRGNLPVVSVGDFNTSKFSSYSGTYLSRMKSAGYGDVLNQEQMDPTVDVPRAETTYRGWVNSFNKWKRDIRDYAYEDARYKTGNGIDWVFAHNNVRVKAWEVVVDLDPSTLFLRGTIPSDHNLVRATLVLP